MGYVRIGLAAVVALLLAAPSAFAGQASIEGATLVYTDTPGAARSVTWARDSSSIAITESTRDVGQTVVPTAGAGCTIYQPNTGTATYVCSAAGVTDVHIDLGDGDDAAEATPGSAFANPVRYFDDTNFPVSVIGGDGKDEITGGEATDTLDGGPGDDQLFGNRDARTSDTPDKPALDTIIGGPGNDTIGAGKSIDGGDGNDMIYGSNSGSTIAGGGGDDSINGGGKADSIDGGAGNDTILSSDGGDTVAAGDGNDSVDTGDGNDTIDGGPGADTVDAGGGQDTVGGGDGPDKLDGGPGADRYAAGDGNDTIAALDDASDVIDCGAGEDTVTGWDRGKDKAVPRESCEHVPAGGLAQRGSFVLGYEKAARTGRMKVRFRCVDCESLRVALAGWQFWFVPNKPGFVLGAGCPPGRTVNLKRTTLDQFDGTLALTPCQRSSLKRALGQVRRGRARFRRFDFLVTTEGGRTTGQMYIGGRP